MKTLLVAVQAEDRQQAAVIAAHEFRVYIASTAKEAVAMLPAKGLDGVVCGVHFNDGDPFSFFQQVRAHPGGSSLPFIVVKGADGRLHPQSYVAVEMACTQEQIPYLDAGMLVQQHGIEAGYAELRRRIAELLG
jgi:hypothetical protein